MAVERGAGRIRGHLHAIPRRRSILANSSPVRVGFLTESRIHAEGLRRILASDSSFVVVGDTLPGAAHDFVKQTPVDILIADGQLQDALALCRELRRNKARPWVILLSAEGDDDWGMNALESGARGILGKSASAEVLSKAIHVVHSGQFWASRRVVARIVEALAARATTVDPVDARLQRLSRREQEVVRHAATGLRNQEIGERLRISDSTVKAHLTRIFQKVGVRDRSQLMALYHGYRPSDARDATAS
jgi:DNA-binding NarL/FixJ family response regulator